MPLGTLRAIFADQHNFLAYSMHSNLDKENFISGFLDQIHYLVTKASAITPI